MIAFSFAENLFENLNPVNSYDKTNLAVFVLSLWEKDR